MFEISSLIQNGIQKEEEDKQVNQNYICEIMRRKQMHFHQKILDIRRMQSQMLSYRKKWNKEYQMILIFEVCMQIKNKMYQNRKQTNYYINTIQLDCSVEVRKIRIKLEIIQKKMLKN
ncbi:unnamed protein product [Paramecium primaurelia]|uniref:Uncharacterized protein n=1 Tax=Paramecium primaurelia TaxID=5886 RepID=A0A8S1M357_PARPR|nr:unnamed protein product [Paramecium primaurelia]